jgi:hypothetical protein
MPRHPHPASEPLRFSVAIPLVTNPWIWLDTGKVLVVPWAALSLLALWILRDEPWSEVWPACIAGMMTRTRGCWRSRTRAGDA